METTSNKAFSKMRTKELEPVNADLKRINPPELSENECLQASDMKGMLSKKALTPVSRPAITLSSRACARATQH